MANNNLSVNNLHAETKGEKKEEKKNEWNPQTRIQ